MDLILVVSLSWVLVLSSEAKNTCPEVKLTGLGDDTKLAIIQSCPGLPGPMGPKGENFVFKRRPKNCKDVLQQGLGLNGWYNIYPDGFQSMPVMCDQQTDGGGWIVFQRRQDGSEDFYRDWNSYKKGFGNQMGEFWLGNDNLYRLTATGSFQLRIDFMDFENQKSFAVYSDFRIASESEKYKLEVGTYIAGDAGDSLSYHKNRPFTTKDVDNDSSSSNCAVIIKSAWWYGDCHHSNLNGKYLGGQHSSNADGINWKLGKGYNYSYKVTEMKFRPF
ncbi:hypothetical protein GDO86_000041 [Hymenochirus boettgeri]|uniref:Fibrinogen C-terminal domain-containing protein n=1 Tax=Hymenochirus boettgeri TaxID=247094 RepID=A0A8T2KFU8_9PIPI|nr:hypothetical protein GDO86_000041 [Hymenochirus boettgeri]